MADRLDVLLGILLDKAAQKDVVSGLTAIEKELGKLDDAQLYKLSLELEAVSEATEKMEKRFAQARQEAERLNNSAEKLTRISTLFLAAGAAIVGGIAASAIGYVKFVEQAGIQGDETADRWIAASKRVKNAQLNLGQAAAQALLPALEKAAELAEKAAAFVNKNPEVVQAALNTGLVVATLGAVGMAVSKGIRLYADFKYLAATAEFELGTRRFEKSVQEFLSGQFLGGKNPTGAGGAAGAGGSMAGTLAASAVAIAIGVVIAKAIVDAVSQGLAQTDFGKKIDEAQRRAAEGGGGYPGINRYARETEKADQAAQDAAQSTGELANGLRDFQQEADMAQATTAYIQYRQQEAQAEEQYMQQRAQIVSQGAAQLAQIEANYANQRAQLARQFAQQSAQAVSNFQYQQAQALEQFNRGEAQAARQYQQQRQQVVEDAQEAELQAEQDHQREMQRLEEDSQERQRDLVAQRDALGLVRERRDLARQQQRAQEDFNTERQRARQETRQRLQDMEENFQQERLRRREEFQYQQAQALEQFQRQQELARQQQEERLKQLEEQHRQEVERSRQQTAERLRDVEVQYREEQIARRNAFYDILRDLNANLLGEQQLRQQYYLRMQQDLMRFLSSASTSTRGSNLPSYPGRQGGGYVDAGLYRMHSKEWVANKETTGALERMLGGRLTQEAVQGFAQSGGASTYNLSFPGGLVTVKQLAGLMEENNVKMLRDLTRGLK